VAGLAVEITVWAAKAATPVAEPPPVAPPAAARPAVGTRVRSLIDPVTGAAEEAAEIARDLLADGCTVAGPAVITEEETTIVLPAGFAATGRADGCIDIRRIA
jgi:N-methylhydantoinase A